MRDGCRTVLCWAWWSVGSVVNNMDGVAVRGWRLVVVVDEEGTVGRRDGWYLVGSGLDGDGCVTPGWD